MRSHPYTPPPPLPPIFDELASMLPPLPNQEPRAHDDMDIPLCELDSETGQLLPARQRRQHHHVRVQGRLALVRSVSTANLRSPTTPNLLTARSPSGTSSPGTPRFETALAGSTAMPKPRRRRSLDDASASDSDEEDERETRVRDRQLRGYGIGGVGNIRRPTEVIYGPTPRASSMNRFSTFYTNTPHSPMASSPEKRWWSLRDIFGRTTDKKGKARVST